MERILNCLSLITRVRRICCKQYYEKTNCSSIYCSRSEPRSIVSWNIQSFFFYLTKQKVQNIILKLNEIDADVVCLQEVFDDSVKKKLIEDLKIKYPYFLLGSTDKKCIFGEDSGLLVLSKYNIRFHKEIYLEDLAFPDITAKKSVLYFSVGSLNLTNMHLQSNNYNLSEKQIKEVLIKSPFQKFLFIGDLNNPKADEILSVEKNNDKYTWNNSRILDYIIPIQQNEIQLNIDVINIELRNTSDHSPVYSTITKKI